MVDLGLAEPLLVLPVGALVQHLYPHGHVAVQGALGLLDELLVHHPVLGRVRGPGLDVGLGRHHAEAARLVRLCNDNLSLLHPLL